MDEKEIEYEYKIYKLILFETLKSLVSCTVEKYIRYMFIDLEYGSKRETESFNKLKDIEKSDEWIEEIEKLK